MCNCLSENIVTISNSLIMVKSFNSSTNNNFPENKINSIFYLNIISIRMIINVHSIMFKYDRFKYKSTLNYSVPNFPMMIRDSGVLLRQNRFSIEGLMKNISIKHK